MGSFGTKMGLLVLASCFLFVPISFGTDITKGEFTGHIDNKPGIKEKPPAAPAQKRKTYPFHGYLQSVDGGNNILTLEGKKPRQIRIDGQTKITRFDAGALLSDGKPGERVTGSVTRDENGHELAVSVKFTGVQASPAKATAKAKKANK